jgi:hypothetical protein
LIVKLIIYRRLLLLHHWNLWRVFWLRQRAWGKVLWLRHRAWRRVLWLRRWRRGWLQNGTRRGVLGLDYGIRRRILCRRFRSRRRSLWLRWRPARTLSLAWLLLR